MAKKTSTKSVKASSKATTKAQPKPATTKTAELVAVEAKPQKEEMKGEAKKVSEKVDSKATAPRARDPRLPAPGTVLQKKDRQGVARCECTVEEDGIRFKGTLYRSLSAAAMAASKDLGLGGQAQNGFLFWGLVRQKSRARRNAE